MRFAMAVRHIVTKPFPRISGAFRFTGKARENVQPTGAAMRGKGYAMAEIDVEELRDHLRDVCGSAMMGGLPSALMDLAEIEDMEGRELCERAEDLGVDLRDFRVDRW